MKNLMITKPGTHEVELRLAKRGERLDWQGIVNAREPGEYELNLVISHSVPDTIGRVEIKGLVENGARVKVKGLVKIEKAAQNTDSFLSMKMLILDRKSMATAEPELSIEANRVKASHSASVGKIDEEQMFYLRSRGVEEKKAKEIIIEGFLN